MKIMAIECTIDTQRLSDLARPVRHIRTTHTTPRFQKLTIVQWLNSAN